MSPNHTLYHLIRYLPRSHQFVIEAISEAPGDPSSSPTPSPASLLTENGGMPLDLGELAREGLVDELQFLHDAFENFIKHQQSATPRPLPVRMATYLPGGQAIIHVGSIYQREACSILKTIQASILGYYAIHPTQHKPRAAGHLHGESTPYELLGKYCNPNYPNGARLTSIRKCVPSFGPTRQTHGLAHAFAGDVKRRSEVYTAITTRRATEQLRSLIEFAPDTYTPMSKLLQALLPPRITYITGHLQYDGGRSPRIGITCEFTGLQTHSVLTRRTIWRCVPTLAPRAFEASGNRSSVPMLAAAHAYIALIEPTVRWLALAIWEYQMTTQSPHRLRPQTGRHYQAEIRYLFGSLYSASADELEDDADFFGELAVEHLLAAIEKEEDWFLPYIHLANLFRRKSEGYRNAYAEAEAQALDKAIHQLFDKALRFATDADEEHDILNRIRGYQAATYLSANEDAQARHKLNQLTITDPPAEFDADIESAVSLLYNLACYFSRLAARHGNAEFKDDGEKSLRYLTYCLICNYDQYQWHDAESDPDLEWLRKHCHVDTLLNRLDKEENRTRREHVLRLYPGPWPYGYRYVSTPKREKERQAFEEQRQQFVCELERLARSLMADLGCA